MASLKIDIEDNTYQNILIGTNNNIELCKKIQNLWTVEKISELNNQIQFALEGDQDYISSITNLTQKKFNAYRDLVRDVKPFEVELNNLKEVVVDDQREVNMLQSPKPVRNQQPQNGKPKKGRGK